MAVIRNVIFDWSGTLVDDFPPVLEATNEIFKHYGREPMTEAQFRETFFLPFPDFYKKYLPEATMVELDHHYHQAFRLLQEDIPMLPFARETLEYCKSQGMKIFLLSTIHPDHYDVQAERLGLKHYFTQAYVRAIDKRQTIVKLIEEHRIDPRETVFVGDMCHDIETAQHGGVASCAVLTGYDSLEKLKGTGPDFLFKDLEGFLRHIRNHRREPAYHPIATVGALIENEGGEVLMIQTHKWSNLWGIPGGKIKADETALDALYREVKEETNLDLESVRFVMVQDCIRSTEFYKPAHFLLLNYHAKCKSGEVILNEEASRFQWVSPQAAAALPINQPTKILLEAVFPYEPISR